jgi:hypothetical protein
MARGDGIRAVLGLPRHAKCSTDKGCGEPIAEEGGNYSGRWVRAPRPNVPTDKMGVNKDGSANAGGDRCSDSDNGYHQPEDGSFW